MDAFVKRLRQRTKALGLTNVDVARRIGLNDRTYAHYAAGRREPNLQTLAKIASALQTTTDHLLGIDGGEGRRLKKQERLADQAKSIIFALDEPSAILAVKLLKTMEAHHGEFT